MFTNSKFLAGCVPCPPDPQPERMADKVYDRMMSEPLNRRKGLNKAQLIEMFGEDAYNARCGIRKAAND